jgi:uncharacterized Zn-finger protein
VTTRTVSKKEELENIMASTATAVVPIIAVNNIPIDELQEQPVSTIIPDFKNSLTEQQQFSCTQCSKALRDPHTLKCHIKTVHGEKKFSCDKCDRRFPHKGALNAHKKTHESASFTCNICNETIKESLCNARLFKYRIFVFC